MPAEAAEPRAEKAAWRGRSSFASLAGSGKDRPRHAARRSLGCPAATRLRRLAQSRGGPRRSPQRSGKSCVVVRRQACRETASPAPSTIGPVSPFQHDPRSRAKYAELRSQEVIAAPARALRSVADRLLNVACAVAQIQAQPPFNPSSTIKNPLDKRWESHHSPTTWRAGQFDQSDHPEASLHLEASRLLAKAEQLSTFRSANGVSHTMTTSSSSPST